jgi:hypothetical protein
VAGKNLIIFPLLKYIRNKEISCAANLVKDYS